MSRDMSGGGVASPRLCLTFPWPAAILSTVFGVGLGHSVVIVVVSTAQRQQAAGAAQVGPQAAGAAQVGAQAAGAAHAGAQAAGAAQVGAQPVLQQLRRTLQQRTLGQRIFGILKQQDFLQQLLQPLLQQVGAGAQQVGAQAAGAAQAGAQTGAAHEGAQAAGAQQLGAGAAHEAGAQPQP
ncbi:MAG: hypothetical protein AABP62_04220 [Planctomycetota bacterium]